MGKEDAFVHVNTNRNNSKKHMLPCQQVRPAKAKLTDDHMMSMVMCS